MYEDFDLETEQPKRGNPLAQNRYRFQSYLKDRDEPCESEWAQTKDEAIRLAARYLIRNFQKFGKDDIVEKIFNEMNYKSEPIVITLDDARKLLSE